jgi:hypothetical protein
MLWRQAENLTQSFQCGLFRSPAIVHVVVQTTASDATLDCDFGRWSADSNDHSPEIGSKGLLARH